MNIERTTDVKRAAYYVREGRVVAFPTGTSYGLAVDALQGFALQRLSNLKKRSLEKSFTIFLRENLWDAYLNLTDQERRYLQEHQREPVTLLVKPRESLAHLAQEGFVGSRIIDHPFMAKLADALDVPLTATSANKAGEEPCFSPSCIERVFTGKPTWQDLPYLIKDDRARDTTYDLSLACILDGGDLPKQDPSTIIRLVDGNVEVIRQ